MFGSYEYSAEVGDTDLIAWAVWRHEYWFLWWRWSLWRWNVQYYQPGKLQPYATFTGARDSEAVAKRIVEFLVATGPK